jgi:hypothetical protein
MVETSNAPSVQILDVFLAVGTCCHRDASLGRGRHDTVNSLQHAGVPKLVSDSEIIRQIAPSNLHEIRKGRVQQLLDPVDGDATLDLRNESEILDAVAIK